MLRYGKPVGSHYHGCEQQGHQQSPSNKQEDDEDANKLIQGTFQPHDHLEREAERKKGKEKQTNKHTNKEREGEE